MNKLDKDCIYRSNPNRQYTKINGKIVYVADNIIYYSKIVNKFMIIKNGEETECDINRFNCLLNDDGGSIILDKLKYNLEPYGHDKFLFNV